jgi:hypothetical protein
MTTRADLEAELTSQLQVASNSTLYPSSRITSLIKNANSWATNLFIWLDLSTGKKTNGFSGQEQYGYPEEIRSETIFRLTVDDESYERVSFEDYLQFREDNSSSDKKMFASFKRIIFIHPTPTSSGSDNIKVWGAMEADDLILPTSTTIFSNNKIEGNEAIVRKAFSVGIKRSDPSLAKSEEQEAVAALLKLNTDEWKSTQRNIRVNRPMFGVHDLFGSGGSTPYGRFAYDPSQIL